MAWHVHGSMLQAPVSSPDMQVDTSVAVSMGRISLNCRLWNLGGAIELALPRRLVGSCSEDASDSLGPAERRNASCVFLRSNLKVVTWTSVASTSMGIGRRKSRRSLARWGSSIVSPSQTSSNTFSKSVRATSVGSPRLTYDGKVASACRPSPSTN
eukprot:497748-Rhodomonas_salina.3